jgi:hypothetical protein
MSTWPMPDMQRQVDSVREAFSADTRKLFVLKPSFPYGSPHSSSHSSPPGAQFRSELTRTGSSERAADAHVQHSQVSYTSQPITPLSASPLDSKSDSPGVQPLAMMTSGHGTQAQGAQQPLALADPPSWNPNRIFE